MLCATSSIRTQTRASTSPAVRAGTSNVDAVVRGIGEDLARVEGAARGAADIAAGGELLDVLRPRMPVS